MLRITLLAALLLLVTVQTRADEPGGHRAVRVILQEEEITAGQRQHEELVSRIEDLEHQLALTEDISRRQEALIEALKQRLQELSPSEG